MDFLQKDEKPYQKEHLHKQNHISRTTKRGKAKEKARKYADRQELKTISKKTINNQKTIST